MSIRQGNKIIAGNVDTTDYTALLNKPQINSIELNGNKTLEELGIQAKGEYATAEDTNEIKENYNKLDNQKTNCLTKIPQDIKLELSEDGTLTKKAGTKFYIPNGFEEDGTTPKFDILVLDKDYSVTSASTSVGTLLQITNPSNLPDFPRVYVENSYSGETAPSGAGYIFWYDTANNLVKLTADGGNNWEPGYSLPYAITTENGSKYTSIDQVFNGFGYIGNTLIKNGGNEYIFANGRNTDGSLNNIKKVLPNLTTWIISLADNISYTLFVRDAADNRQMEFLETSKVYKQDSQPTPIAYAIWYSPRENKWRYILSDTSNGWLDDWIVCEVATFSGKDGRITSFSPKTTFQAIDRNDSEWASSASKPSDRYVDVTVDATGSTYTALENGWFGAITQNSSMCNLHKNQSNGNFCIYNMESNVISDRASYIPVNKGDNITFYYNGSVLQFRFYYDNGAK